MAKAGSKIEKVTGKKKVNHYTKAQCVSELARLDSCHKDKKGVVLADSSQYRKDVQERLNVL